MFICKRCLEENYYNFGMFLSFGICEECNKHSYCHDIPSGDLNSKKNQLVTAESVNIRLQELRMKFPLSNYQIPQDISLPPIAEQLKDAPSIKESLINLLKSIKTDAMITTEDYSQGKNPWTWLWFGDKSLFTLGWALFCIIAGWVSYPGWMNVLMYSGWTWIILIGLIFYRISDYIARVRKMDIMSFSNYRNYKKSH